MTLLTVVVSIVLAIVCAAAAAFLWKRRQSRVALRTYFNMSPYLIDPVARITLATRPLGLDGNADAVARLRNMWREMEQQGVVKLAELETSHHWSMIAGRHGRTGILVVAVLPASGEPFMEFIALSQKAGVAAIVTGEQGAQPLSLPSLAVTPMRHPSLAKSLAPLAALLPARSLDVRQFMMLYERLYATRMDVVLATPPTEHDAFAQAASFGVYHTVSDQERAEMVRANRASWLAAVRTSMLDHGRRSFGADTAKWDALAASVVALHAEMTADEVIAELSGCHRLAAKLGEQLKRQNFTPLEIFDEINRRLDANVRRVPVARVGAPVAGAVYAAQRDFQPATAMQSRVAA